MHKLRNKLLELLENSKFKKSPEAEMEQILLHAFRLEHPKLHRFSELLLLNPAPTEFVEEEALRIARERAKGIPLQHILGVQYFYEHEYRVNDSTLIPRPETEILVREAILWLESKFQNKAFRFAELGIGSGIISGEILHHFKNSTAWASEPEPLAIALARENLELILGGDIDRRITLLEPQSASVGFEIFLDAAPFDFVISNPPYLADSDPIEEEVSKHEPRSCLFPKIEGSIEKPNYFYENFITHARTLLKPGGSAFFEISDLRAETLQHEFERAGFHSVRLIQDLTGRNRVLQATLSD